MVNGKIKEWHLEAELLQKLISGGSSDFTEALRDYIKKTDIIESSQLSEDFLASIENKLQAIRDNIRNNYRDKNTAITEEDLDDSLQTLLETFYQSQEFSGFTRQEVEDIFFAYITDTIEQYDRFDNIEQNIKNEVQQEIQPVLNNMSERIETAENQVTDLMAALNAHQEEAEDSYRKKSNYISEEDIDPAIVQQIQSNEEEIQNLQNRINEFDNKSLDIYGEKNQVLIVGDNNSIETSDIVTKLNIAVTTEELNSARAELISPIYSFVTPQSVYTIGLGQWNDGSNRISQEETNPIYVPPEPEPMYYTVHYVYTYTGELPEGTDSLPQSVLRTLPADETEHLENDTIIPEMPTQYIDTDNGTWIFDGWTPNEVTIEDQDVTITGTWHFEESVQETTYAVHYQCSGYVPETVLALMPKDETGKWSGMIISPKSPYSEYVLDEDQLWHFEGWNPEYTIIDNQDAIFTGTWSSETVDPNDPAYQQYKDIVVPEESNDDDNDSTNSDNDNPSVNPSNDPGSDDNTSNDNNPNNEPPESQDDESEEDPYVPLLYKDYILSTSNIKMDELNVQINDTITGTNDSEIDKASIVIGFYGTRFKLYSSLQETEQEFQVIIDNNIQYNIVLQEESLFAEDIETDHVCCCCVENLSEGLHTIRIVINPGKSLLLDNKISLDDSTHSDLLDIADIPNDEFFEQTMFDTGDYVGSLSRSYDFVKSENLHVITSSDYENDAFETGETGYERKLLYALNSKKLFYMDDTGMLITLSSPYEAKLAELEARIAALEA